MKSTSPCAVPGSDSSQVVDQGDPNGTRVAGAPGSRCVRRAVSPFPARGLPVPDADERTYLAQRDRCSAPLLSRGMTPLFSASQTERLGELIDPPPCAGPTGTASPVRAAPRLGSG